MSSAFANEALFFQPPPSPLYFFGGVLCKYSFVIPAWEAVFFCLFLASKPAVVDLEGPLDVIIYKENNQISGCALFSYIACEFSLENFSYIQWWSFWGFPFSTFHLFPQFSHCKCCSCLSSMEEIAMPISRNGGMRYWLHGRAPNKQEWSISWAKWKNTNQCKLLVVVLILNLSFFWT